MFLRALQIKRVIQQQHPTSRIFRLLGSLPSYRLVSCIWLIALLASPVFSFPMMTGQLSLAQPLTVQWQFPSEQTLNLTPATDGERVYLPLAAGFLVSLRIKDGLLLWRTEIGGELSATPVADERGVYIASENSQKGLTEAKASGTLRLLGRESGVTLWVRQLPIALRSMMAMNVSTIFGSASDGRIYAISKKTGEVIWEKQFPAPTVSRLTLVGQNLYVGTEDGILFSLEQTTGRTLWRYQTRSALRGRVAVADGIVYFGSTDGYVYSVREANGSLRWRTRTGAGVQSVLSIRNGLLVASLDNFVYFLTLTRGDRIWKRQLAGRLAAEPLATTDGALFTPLSGDSGVVLGFKDGKQINSLPLGEDNNTAAAPIIAGNVLLVTTRHGLLAFSHPQAAATKKE